MSRRSGRAGGRRQSKLGQLEQQLEQAGQALQDYVSAQRRHDSIRQCPSVWPPSQAPGELGTRCDLIEGHEPDDPDEDGLTHRHRVKPTQCVVRW